MRPVLRAAAHATNVIPRNGASCMFGHRCFTRVRSHKTMSALVVWTSNGLGSSSPLSRIAVMRGAFSFGVVMSCSVDSADELVKTGGVVAGPPGLGGLGGREQERVGLYP